MLEKTRENTEVVSRVYPLALHKGDIVHILGKVGSSPALWFRMRIGSLVLLPYTIRHSEFLNEEGKRKTLIDLCSDQEIAVGKWFPQTAGGESYSIGEIIEIRLQKRPCEIVDMQKVTERDLLSGNRLVVYLSDDSVINLEVGHCNPIVVMNALPHPNGFDYEMWVEPLRIGQHLTGRLYESTKLVRVFRAKEVIHFLNIMETSSRLGNYPLKPGDLTVCSVTNIGDVCFDLKEQVSDQDWLALMNHCNRKFDLSVRIRPGGYGYYDRTRFQTAANITRIQLTRLK